MPFGALRAARVALWALSLLLALRETSAADDAARLDAGEVLIDVATDPDSGVHSARARWVMEAAPEAVWEIVSDCSRYRETMILVQSSEELERNGDTTVCRSVGELPWPLPDPEATVRSRNRVGEGRWHRAWELVEGDFDVHEGSWTLVPFDSHPGRTLVEYRARMKPSFPVPGWVLTWAQGRELPRLAAHLREQVRDGAGGADAEPEGREQGESARNGRSPGATNEAVRLDAAPDE